MSSKHLNRFVLIPVLIFSLCSLSATPAYAVALNLNADDIWADGGGGPLGPASSTTNDTVDISVAATTMTVRNNGVNDDDGGLNTFVIGAVTDSGGSGIISITSEDEDTNDGALDVTIASVNIGGAFTAAQIDDADQDSTVTITGALTVGGALNVTNNEVTNDDQNITMTVGGNSAVTGTTTITGSAGAGAGADATLILNGTTNSAGAFTLDDDTGGLATLTLSGGGAQSLTGVISGAGAGEGTVTTSGAGTNVTFNSNIGGTQLLAFTVGAGTTAQLGAGTLSATTITNNGILELDTAVTATGTTLELGGNAASQLTMGASSYTGNTILTATGVTTINTTNAVQVNTHANFSSGTLTLIDSPGTGAGSYNSAANYTINNDNLLTSYSISVDGNSDVLITASRVSSASLASTLNTTESAADALGTGFDATVNDSVVNSAYQSVLAAGGQAATDAAEQSQPEANGGTVEGIQNVGQLTLNTIGSHLSSIRNTEIYTGGSSSGVSTGDGTYASGLWARGFVHYGDQDKIGTVAGYDLDTWGLATGWDTMLNENTRGGVGYSYGNTEVDSDGVGNNHTEVDSHQIFVYGDITMDSWYIEGIFGYGINTVETSRDITFGGLNRTALGDYDADQIMAAVELGVPINLDETTVLTPKIGYNFSIIESDSYTETGAGTLNLVVDPEDLETHALTAGLELYQNITTDDGTLTPEIRGGFAYDFADEDPIASSKFSGTTTSFNTVGPDTEDWEASAGGGLSWTTPDGQWIISGDYDAIFKEEYLGHSGRVEVLYRY